MDEGRRLLRFLMPGWLFLLELGLFVLLPFVSLLLQDELTLFLNNLRPDPITAGELQKQLVGPVLTQQADRFFAHVPKGAWTPLSLAIGAAGVPIGYLIFQLYYFCYWSRLLNGQGRLLWRASHGHALAQARTFDARLPEPIPLDPRGNWDPYTALWYQVLGKGGRDMGIEDRTQRMVDIYHAAGANFIGLLLAFSVWLLVNFLFRHFAGWSQFSDPSHVVAVLVLLLFTVLHRAAQHRTLLEYQYFMHSSLLSLLATGNNTTAISTICFGCQTAYDVRRTMPLPQRLVELWGPEPQYRAAADQDANPAAF